MTKRIVDFREGGMWDPTAFNCSGMAIQMDRSPPYVFRTWSPGFGEISGNGRDIQTFSRYEADQKFEFNPMPNVNMGRVDGVRKVPATPVYF